MISFKVRAEQALTVGCVVAGLVNEDEEEQQLHRAEKVIAEEEEE